MAALAASIAVAFTRPFSWQADLVTALGIAGVVCGGGIALRTRLAGRPAFTPDGTPEVCSRPSSTLRAAGAWIAIAALVTGFELLSLFSEPRRAHPTISSLLGLLTAHAITKAVVFACWLAVGWWTWRDGAGEHVPTGSNDRA